MMTLAKEIFMLLCPYKPNYLLFYQPKSNLLFILVTYLNVYIFLCLYKFATSISLAPLYCSFIAYLTMWRRIYKHLMCHLLYKTILHNNCMGNIHLLNVGFHTLTKQDIYSSVSPLVLTICFEGLAQTSCEFLKNNIPNYQPR